jgi:hypothetical protein
MTAMTTQLEHTTTTQREVVTTVRDATYEVLRGNGLTTIFGNVGSTEETFLDQDRLLATSGPSTDGSAQPVDIPLPRRG